MRIFFFLQIAKHLVERGVPAGAVDSQGATPLHYAACNHNLAFCRFLWERSPSSVDVADNDGVTPFAAVFSNTESGMITLVEFFVSPSTCHIKNLDVCYTVQSRGNMQSQDSTTPLIEAVVSNNEKVVSDLLKHGASVNFPNRNGRTPIMEAVLDNLMDMVKVLIYATDDRSVWASKETTQVDLSLQDKSGNSVIHLCVQNREVSGAIVHHKAKDLWVLFNRWGRIGDRGQHQRTPYNDPDLATTEFKKIFKSKTGNEWKDKDK
ncbi:PREDICTED: ankyrin repeat, PH and SEC7 domain containing protein secG-like [Acropora digitifera]|uniref:ankyrin repeat, PH and SEC7 domain containing protein secG-like n=1 Tax=Acropora digitifera TaxID=70779 RepID=UPI00077B062A|nr:PREDICTED: ankyrin repeat, PH and SEC7 domain containing protein secG-like [Acropora digitifera]